MHRTLAVVVTLAITALPARADDAARAVVEKAVKAAGWEKDPADIKMSWKDTGKFAFMGMEMKYVADWTFIGPDKLHFAMKADFGGMKLDVVAVSNGKSAWESAMGKARDIEGDKLEQFRREVHLLHVIGLAPLLKDKAFQLTSQPDIEIDGKKHAAVKVTRDGKPDIELAFDKETGLLAKAKTMMKDEFQGWKEVTEETHLAGWKDAGGRKVFTKMKTVRDGKPLIETELSDQKVLDNVDLKLLEKPE